MSYRASKLAEIEKWVTGQQGADLCSLNDNGMVEYVATRCDPTNQTSATSTPFLMAGTIVSSI